MSDQPQGGLADALISCGINPEEVEVVRDDLCQEDVLTLSTASVPEAVLIDLAELYLSFPSRFVFASQELDDAFQAVVLQSPRLVRLRDEARNQQHEWLETRGLSAFPPFDPQSESVGDFAARVEMACDAEVGDLISEIREGGVSIDAKDPAKLTLDRMKTLMALLEICAPTLCLGVTGQDMGDVR